MNCFVSISMIFFMFLPGVAFFFYILELLMSIQFLNSTFVMCSLLVYSRDGLFIYYFMSTSCSFLWFFQRLLFYILELLISVRFMNSTFVRGVACWIVKFLFYVNELLISCSVYELVIFLCSSLDCSFLQSIRTFLLWVAYFFYVPSTSCWFRWSIHQLPIFTVLPMTSYIHFLIFSPWVAHFFGASPFRSLLWCWCNLRRVIYLFI
jgi:hypothetical protein